MASIRWSDLHKYSLIWVEFGNNITDLDCDDELSYLYGLNTGHEFCYRHMAIVVSNDIKANIISVVPLTSYKINDEKYFTNVVIDTDKYGYMVKNKTTIKILIKRKELKKSLNLLYQKHYK